MLINNYQLSILILFTTFLIFSFVSCYSMFPDRKHMFKACKLVFMVGEHMFIVCKHKCVPYQTITLALCGGGGGGGGAP